MELKVSVDGLPRLVCGVTEETTSQDVVTVLAQALGQPGRYMLRESYKDFERCMAPNERPLETLRKYGEHAKEVRLTLLHSGPWLCDQLSRAKVGRHQMRRKEAGAKAWRRSGSLSLHRQSLPLRRDAERHQEDLKRPKRKSLTLMEEARGWLESLGKTRVYSTAGDKKNRSFLSVTLSSEKRQAGGRRNTSDLDHQTSCCMGIQQKSKETESYQQDEKNRLRGTVVRQLARIQELQSRTAGVDREISEFEERARARQEQQKISEDQEEQVKIWENELKAEEGFERELQHLFLDTRAKVADCKARLESADSKSQDCADHNPTTSQDHYGLDENLGRPSGNLYYPPPPLIKERRPTGPAELREWWTRWSASQRSTSSMKKIHRSELTIYLAGTKV
ncbi:ras association domain-containing protein 8 isoform X2 [Nerophis ophidion]|nr:ras association domain-containing protein 8 isoform X2 [Nerophis ophidion]